MGSIDEIKSAIAHLPEEEFENQYLFLPLSFEIFELYSGNRLLYRTGDVKNAEGSMFRGVEWHLVKLPENNAKTLDLLFYSANSFLIGPAADSIKIGKKETLIEWMITKDLHQLIISVIFLFIAVSSILMWIMDRKIILVHYSFLNLMFFIYFFNLTDVKQLYYHNPVIALLLWDFSISLATILVNVLFSSLFRSIRVYTYFNILFVLFNIVKFSAVGFNSFNEWTFFQNIMIVGGMFSLLFAGMYVYVKDKNKHALLYGIIVAFATIIGAFEAFSNNMQHSAKTNMFYVFLIMTMFIGFIGLSYYMRLEKMYSELSYKDEINEKILVEMMYANLKSRINPHFLFNTLNIIHAYINTRPGVARQALENIAEYYRYLTDYTSQDLVSLEEEWKFTRNFLNLHELKYENKFSYKFRKKGNLKNISVPPLIIQPVVENSLQHGLRAVKRKGFISVSITVENKYVRIEVKDNGAGLNSEFKNSRTLDNIRQRLEYNYNNVDVSIQNTGDNKEGVTVNINFEAVKK